jgi:hypothetical protein
VSPSIAVHCAGLASAIRSSPLNLLARAVGINLSSLESGLTLEGQLGGYFRRLAYWYRQPTNQQKVRVGQKWLEGLMNQGSQAVAKQGTSSRPPGGVFGK